jgi:hypothetical protein
VFDTKKTSELFMRVASQMGTLHRLDELPELSERHLSPRQKEIQVQLPSVVIFRRVNRDFRQHENQYPMLL